MVNYTVEPEKATQNEMPEITFDSFFVPGSQEYEVAAILDVEDVMEEGDLIPAETVQARRVFGEFIEEYENDSETLGIFLGYAENDWTSEEMWRNTDYSRGELYNSTEKLEDNYGLIETDFGNVSLTQEGKDVYDAFEILAEE